ncbi:hypothetical protein V6N12_050943 [Hibiscus sabdariffa]|uniref:Uncharacterized protein n=1 Tax=Hibiscus sabdariffa TaxID=183260 RepID=A0ABR2GDV9_9ROSI
MGVASGVVLDPLSSVSSDPASASTAKSAMLMLRLAFLLKRRRGTEVSNVGAGYDGASGMSSSSSLSKSIVSSGACAGGVGLIGAFTVSFLVRVRLADVQHAPRVQEGVSEVMLLRLMQYSS